MRKVIKPETMSKLAIILCVAIFATTTSSSLLASNFQIIRTRVESIVGSAISTIKARFEPAKQKALEKVTKLEEEARKFTQKLIGDVTVEIKKARERVKSIADRAKGINISKCTALVKELDPASAQVYSETSGCATEKVKIGANYVDSLKKNTDIVTKRLSELREEGLQCSGNATSPRTALQAVVCIKTVAAKAAWTAAKAVPSITGVFVKIDYLLATLRVSLTQCTASKALAKFSSYTSDIIKRVEQCVQQQFADAKKPSKNETTSPPKGAPTTAAPSSTSGPGKGSTKPSSSGTTPPSGAGSSTAKPTEKNPSKDATTNYKDATTASYATSTEKGSTTPDTKATTPSGWPGEKGSSSDTGASTPKPYEQSTDKDSSTKEKDRATESATVGTDSNPTTPSGQPGEKDAYGDAGASTSKPNEQSPDKADSSTEKDSAPESSTVAGADESSTTPDIDVDASTSKPSEPTSYEDASTKKSDGTTESSKSDSESESTTQSDNEPTEGSAWPGEEDFLGKEGASAGETSVEKEGATDSSKSDSEKESTSQSGTQESADKFSGEDAHGETEVGSKSEQSSEKPLIDVSVQVNV